MKDKDYILNSGLLEQYVLGLTNPEESREVEHYASIYPEVKMELHAMGHAMEQYARQFSIPAPKKVKNAIITELNNLDKGKQNAASPASSVFKQSWLSVASMAAAIILGIIAFRSNSAHQQSIDQLGFLQTEYQALVSDCADQRKQQAAQAKIFAMLTNKSTVPVPLKGTSLAKEAQVIVYVNEQSQTALLNAVNLPDPPKDKQYQIWADVEGKMLDMGVINRDTSALQALHFVENAESFNITLEPLGGSKEPTVEFLILYGKIG